MSLISSFLGLHIRPSVTSAPCPAKMHSRVCVAPRCLGRCPSVPAPVASVLCATAAGTTNERGCLTSLLTALAVSCKALQEGVAESDAFREQAGCRPVGGGRAWSPPGAGTPQDLPVPDISDKTYRVIPAPQGQAPLPHVFTFLLTGFQTKQPFDSSRMPSCSSPRVFVHAAPTARHLLPGPFLHASATLPATHAPLSVLRTLPGLWGGPFICPPPWAQQVHRERDVLAACVKH